MKIVKEEIVYKSLDEIKEYENNPRQNDEAVEYVANSIKEFGFRNPIILDKDNVIIAGHTRYKASKQLKLKEVPCIYANDLTEEQVKAFRLADNKVGEIAEWDDDLLKIELDDILDIDMSDLGFDDIDLDVLDEETEVTEDEFDGELKDEVTVQKGDIYKLGRHRLMCGDSTSLEDVEKLTGGVKVDLLITDPPYNVNYGNVRDVSEAIKLHKRTDGLIIQNDNMDAESFRNFLRDAFTSADSVMREGACFYIWHADNEGYNFRGACMDIGWKVRQCLIWNKNSMVMGRQDYQWKHEPCLYGWKDGAGHTWASDRKQTTVLDFTRPTRNELHPTMKPVPLFAYQIQNNTRKGDKVLDLFGGSGTTLIACEQNGREAYLMELDEKYVDAIIRRYEELTGEKAELIERR